MDSPIKIFMTVEDANLVQKIFDRSLEPHFTILSRFALPEYPATVQLEVYFESPMHLWYLAKQVEMEQAHEERLKTIIDETLAKIKNQP